MVNASIFNFSLGGIFIYKEYLLKNMEEANTTKTDKKEVIKGRWWEITKEGEIPIITAKYDRLKDWKMDPKGYFLIKIYPEKKEIGIGYCTFPDNRLRAEIRGKTALEIVNTAISEGMISSLQHAADMGIELCKAEIALKKEINYVQDDPLNL